MTEPIKQEIINNIFENGDKLITGPILQTVLIDMIDDVNVKDQEILSKTGSWDDAATQIPNLATKEEVTNLSESVARDLENVVGGDLTGYATEQWVESQGYLKEHQDISNLATKAEVTNLSESVARDLASVPEGVATEAWVQSQDYASKSYVDNAVSSSSVDLTGYATETWVESQGYLKEHQDISGLATKSELTSVSESIQTDISNLATKTELNSVSESVQTDITNLSESVANSAVWKKGTGTDSIVQILTGDNEAFTPTASGERAIATGKGTNASGWYGHAEGFLTNALGNTSHAEGSNTKASEAASHAEGSRTSATGMYSHAEGFWTQAIGQASHAEGSETKASGSYSHTEGGYTVTSNQYEHAQGRYNYTSSNQIFSIGTGNSNTDRRNAVSVLEVDNSGSYTASFFVQNIGGYDGTNPEPGTNDLATVINGMSSGGGSSETLWKKGEGKDSIVQVIADGTNLPTASGERAIAIGYGTIASGYCSHAEGQGAKASGIYSHAEGLSNASGPASHAEGKYTNATDWYSHVEGLYANAEGSYSHAEGYNTIASNSYEHAQGRYNHNSENQIFSIGTGNSDTDRRNAVSVLEVSNNDSYTSSFFVQNIGGYDGTNPTPGTNDLATVINGLSSGGGSSETLWKKGTGTDSIVQILSGDNEVNTSTATGTGSIAIGFRTTASADYSHAEGDRAKASGMNSHAEGYYANAEGESSHAEGYQVTARGYYSHAEGDQTLALGQASHAEGRFSITSGSYSHAEGGYTTTSNQYEHAQGQYNYTSSNQIFSVGAGEKIGETVTRRNAVSVLSVPNSETQINTASVFIQNVGGYDGTNPTPGTNDLATVINGLSSGGSSETLWKKGTGTDSIVQVIADGTNPPTATGERAIATGRLTVASGSWSHAEGNGSVASGSVSHAEGQGTKALGNYSHAEGVQTITTGEGSHAEGNHTTSSGNWSHAEGLYTIASNNYEHAQGTYNHSSENQIFSVGAGEIVGTTVTRRNAISILAVPNGMVLTSSVFVQNVGGYDGTNPTPGTNDLATVLNNTETWTFTLEDGSTVTKNIRIS